MKRNNKINKTALSFGSNTGNRESNILNGVRAIESIDGCSLELFSSLYETEPVGEGRYSRDFINAAAIFSTSLDPLALLAACKETEAAFGRDVLDREADRPLDIDIIIYGDETIDSDELKVPHPRFPDRSFVVVPLMEICPDIPIPPGKKALSDYIANNTPRGWTRVVSSRYLLR